MSNISSPYKRVKTTNSGINPSKKLHTGTTISFIPDETIFGDLAKLDVESIKKKCELKTYLNAGLKIVLTVDKEKFTYYHKKGLLDYIQSKMTNPLYNMDTIFIDDKDEDENSYQIAMVFNNDTEEYIDSFVNSLPLSEGGTQETGFKKALTQVFTDYINKNGLLTNKDKGLQIKGEDIRRGLVCVINMKHDNPLYDSGIMSGCQ